MHRVHKAGGFAALYAGLAYVIGIVGFLFVLRWPDAPVQQVVVLVENQFVLHLLYVIVYQVWAIALVVLTIALYDRLKADEATATRIATAIGIIWATVVVASGMVFNVGMKHVVNLHQEDSAQATTAWIVIASICDGLGGGNEILGGTWMLLLSWIALRSQAWPKSLAYLGIVVGGAGVLSALPGLGDTAMVFGVVQIIWFIWLGIFFLRDNSVTSIRS